MALRVVKDLTWLDLNQTEAAPTTNSDPGTGAYPKVTIGDRSVLLQTGDTTQVTIPFNRVIKVVSTVIP